VIGRATQGVRVIALDESDRLVDVARLVPEDDAAAGIDIGGEEVPVGDGPAPEEFVPAGGGE